ncbi:MAG: hypothetical protein KDB14_31520 [Planctomycetales bacterium]|nr:hypothetical protein [Planctomycetales bacterium]
MEMFNEEGLVTWIVNCIRRFDRRDFRDEVEARVAAIFAVLPPLAVCEAISKGDLPDEAFVEDDVVGEGKSCFEWAELKQIFRDVIVRYTRPTEENIVRFYTRAYGRMYGARTRPERRGNANVDRKISVTDKEAIDDWLQAEKCNREQELVWSALELLRQRNPIAADFIVGWLACVRENDGTTHAKQVNCSSSEYLRRKKKAFDALRAIIARGEV